LRKTPECARLAEGHPNSAKSSGEAGPVRRSPSVPWTPEDDDNLFKFTAVRGNLREVGVSG
jgi:hypothetical protein